MGMPPVGVGEREREGAGAGGESKLEPLDDSLKVLRILRGATSWDA